MPERDKALENTLLAILIVLLAWEVITLVRPVEKQSCATCKNLNLQRPEFELGHCQAPLPFWVLDDAVHMPSNFVRTNDGTKCPAYQRKEEIE